mgnify:CR=1 FL=1
MPKVHTMEVKDQFIELRAKGHTLEEVGRTLDVSKPTLIGWQKEFQTDIGNRKALEMEALQEKYKANWFQRIKTVGEEVEKLNEELEKRDYSDMATKEILEVKLKYLKELKELERKVSLEVESDPVDDMNFMLSTKKIDI